MKKFWETLRLGGQALREAGSTIRLFPNVEQKPVTKEEIIRQANYFFEQAWRQAGDAIYNEAIKEKQ